MMDNPLYSQHTKNITDKRRRDGNAKGKTIDAQHNSAKNTAARTTAAKENKAHTKATDKDRQIIQAEANNVKCGNANEKTQGV